MNEKYRNYYRTDIACQEATRERVRHFTHDGYKRLNQLIPLIKAGDDEAEQEFVEITKPWAEYIVNRHNKKNGLWLEADDIFRKAIGQIKTDEDVTDWGDFSAIFSRIMVFNGIRLGERLSGSGSEERSAESLMAEIYRAVRGDAVAQDDPAAGLEAEDLRKAIQETILRLSPEDRQLFTLRARNAESTVLSRDPFVPVIAVALGEKAKTVQARLSALPHKFFEAGMENPLLAQWFKEHHITADDFAQVKAENVSKVYEQKAIIARIFDFRDITGQAIIQKLKVGPNVVSCLFGDSMSLRYHGVLSQNTERKLTEYLEKADKSAEDIASFKQAFDTLRGLAGVKIHSRRAEDSSPQR